MRDTKRTFKKSSQLFKANRHLTSNPNTTTTMIKTTSSHDDTPQNTSSSSQKHRHHKTKHTPFTTHSTTNKDPPKLNHQMFPF